MKESIFLERPHGMHNPQRSRTVTTRIAALGVACVAGTVGTAVFAAPAWAHDSVVSSTPGRGESVSELPEDIVLEFSGEPKDGFNTVALSHDGNVLFSGEPSIEGRVLTLEVPSDVTAEPGDYLIGYQITSSDGHATRGSLDFTLEGDAVASDNNDGEPQNAADSAEGEQGDTQTGVPTWLLPLGGIVVIAGALVMAIMRFRDLKKSGKD